MGHLVYITLVCVIAISYSYGCDIDPPGTPWIPQSVTIKDIERGTIFTLATRNIAGIANVGPTQNLNGGPYFNGVLNGSQLIFYIIDSNFEDYEENETADNTSLTILFNCVGGTTRSMTIIISITDTNNNDPRFLDRPTNEIEFNVIPPLPPGFSITGCLNDITVRDIDLTTKRIDFEIFESPLFEISYDAALSTVPKEFKASLRTTTFIRSIPEPIEFKISATDVDATGDPPRTTFATVRIKSADGGFELPDEPVFTQAFYLASYTDDDLVILKDKISLRQGYNERVNFTLDQGTTRHFDIRTEGNDVSIIVVTPLTEDFLVQRQIVLVIKAESENTSGASATIIVELPEEEELKFEQPTYEGAIVDNVLQLSRIVVSQGNPVSVEILSEYEEFFKPTLEQNIITLAMSPLDDNIIEENTFLNLRVIASSNRTSVSTVVTLEIVKDDSVTPVFERAVYAGFYNTSDGLSLERIVLVQGYDATVRVSLQGEHSDNFKLDQDGPITTLELDVTSLPTELFREQNLLLYLKAAKPRTVGATTAISIALPPEIQLEFEQQYYRGVIEDNVLHLSELILSNGYESGIVTVTIISKHATFFRHEIVQNKITLLMSPLDAETIEQNTFLNLEIVAATVRSSASTIVSLEIIKDDFVTPTFDRAVYAGVYDPIGGLTLDEIVITQGYDESVRVSLQGEHSSYFEIDRLGPLINLTISSLPSSLFREQNLILTIEATKPRTVGANAAISIALPAEIKLEFEEPNYKGSIIDNVLQLTDLILRQGYDDGPVSISIDSKYESYFKADIDRNKITLSMSDLDSNIIEQNNFLNLRVVASTNRSSALTIVTLEIIKDDFTTPVFERNVYEGTYDSQDGLKIEDIVLVQGYDKTLNVVLIGENASLFEIDQEGPKITLAVKSSNLPASLLSLHGLLLSIEATKPRTVGANAAISIAFPEARVMRFDAEVYTGRMQENLLEVDNIVLGTGYTDDVDFTLSGEFASYFNVTNVHNQITVGLRTPIPDTAIKENNFLLLTLSASALNAVTASTTIAIEIIKEDLTTPVFSQNIYYGTYIGPSSIDIGTISLSQGSESKVSFRLHGEHSQYFRIRSGSENGTVVLELHSAIPEEVIFNEKVLLFSILAEKELTVGANAAVSINFPRELTEPSVLRFAKNIYIGSLQQNVLSLESVVLETGYGTGTQFTLAGEFSQYFTLSGTNNIQTISAVNPLPIEVFNRKFISLELEARRTRAVPVSTTIIIDIEQPEIIVPPVFTEAYYRGSYTQENGLRFEDVVISLSQGFDETVEFILEGESAQWFNVSNNNETVEITTKNDIPEEIVEANNHLMFSVVAQKPGAIEGRAAILVDLPKENISEQVLGFDRLSYVGSIANNVIDLSPLVLREGPTSGVTFSLHGEMASYFRVTPQGATAIVSLPSSIPVESIPSNRIIVLEIQATSPTAAPAYATIVFHVALDDDTPPVAADLVFDATYYVGSYTSSSGLAFSPPITLAEGYDPDVVFTLEGESAQWFRIPTPSSNSVTLEISNPIPPAVVANNQKLVFVIRAQRPGGVAARATVVISLPDENTSDQVLGFDRLSYVGFIANNIVNLSPIVLREGPTSGVTFSLHGELASYFRVTPQDATAIVSLPSSIPVESIPSNRIIVLEIQATSPTAAPAYATIVFHVALDDDTPPVSADLVFDATYYVGSYTSSSGLAFSPPITLAEGYDLDVVFTLEGESAQWFRIPTPSSNSVTLEISNPIPPAVVANNQKLVFVIRAQRPGGVAARATVVISLPDENTSDQVLGFDRLSYVGSIANNIVNLSPIVLREGPTSGVTFSLHGELASYFRVTPQGATAIVSLPSSIPVESIPSNRIIVLEIQATSPTAAPAYATIVFHVVLDDDTPPVAADLVFDATYYVGSYTSSSGLAFSPPITLAEGYDPDVVFTLEGESAQWFRIPTPSSNSVTLEISNPIPPAVVANNQKLVFVIRAQRPGGVAARATVVISLPDENTSDQVLGFDRLSYVGSIANNIVNLSPIVLREGPTSGVTFSLHGELASYFRVTPQGATAIVSLPSSIPVESIPSNRIIVLEIQATSPTAAPAYATIVFHVALDDDTPPVAADLVFDATYYVGSYTSSSGLAFSPPITLAEGYDPDVVFTLEGESAQWFRIPTPSSNSVTLEISNPIPPAVVANNQKLVFVIRAQRPGGVAARATVVISLPDENTSDQVLGFDRLSYVGSIANNIVNLSPIVLREGPTSGVTFSLHGELASYFRVTPQGATAIVSLPSSIPVESIPSNRIIVLEIQATSPTAAPAYATIVFHVALDDDTPPVAADLVFDATYYVGSYTSSSGLAFSPPITLAEGYDPDVVFTLEGESAQWFRIPTPSSNSVTLEISNPIPPAVVANNQKLVFVIRAQRPGGVAARATVVISLPDENTSDQVLGFDRLSYVGSIANNIVNLSPIVLREGPTSGVTFSLHGELASYFRVTPQGATAIVSLPSSIPVESIPSNRIIVLEIQATSPTAAPAYATIVFHVALDDDTPPVAADLVFDATYYVGSYTSSSGLAFSPPITLAEGYDPDVVFTLEGESAQWFRIPTPSSNSVTLEISNPIPPAVVANNQKLVFVIRAQRPGGVAARATVVISLPDENTSDQVLGFDRLSYVGSIANNIVNLSPIVLREGPTSGVTFSLHGELASYFRVTPQGATAIVSLPSSIPVESIPSNRIIVLEIQATSPTAAPAYATIVFHVALDDDTPPVAADLVFDATYYVGSYTSSSGLAFSPPITLAEGYDPDVVFTLEGESAQWFRIPTPSSNSVTLEISNPIPPAVVANNQKLVFVIRAQRPGGVAARATVVISLPDENTSDQVLGFDRLSYVGSIANNIVNLSPIVLREGPTSGVTFSLHGELASYFRVTPQGATAIVSLPSSIPVESIPSNRIIVLEIQATSPTAAPAYATIVFHVALDDDTPPVAADLVFDATYYVGSYTSSSGLAFSPPITLAEGYDPDVVFTLEGESAQWFRIPTPSSNSVTLEISNPIPPAVVANNQKLVFVIRAQRPGGVAARATVVISLPDENTSDQVLGFDRLSYVGSIANNIVNLSPIVLREGPTSGVTFSLHGELASYFRVTPQGATAIVSLPSSIPVESIPSNRIIVLEIQATSPTAAPAYATIVFHVVLDDDTPPVAADLVFDATYYVGSYTSSSGLAFSPPITLAEGYDPDVVFTLEGESAQWFRIPTPSSNSVTLEISNPIPPAVVANNQKLVFVIRAQRPGGVAARATVVISLPDENTSDQVLGFDRLSYVGSIANNIVNLSPIVLREGPTSGVTFSLHGELASYFRVTPQGATAIVSLPSSIPVESIPSNRIIVLEIQATSPTAAPAYATIVFHVALDDDTPPVAADLVFDATYYVGSYTSSSGLAFSPPITLAEGYDPDVVFTLEGESAQWFRIPTPSSNSVTLEISNPIPPAVVANNQKLVFVIRAQRPGGVAARATVVISLPDENTSDQVLGFDRLSYVGSIANNIVNLSPIVLREGPTSGVTFSLHGELASYFRVTPQGATAIVSLPSSIPVESIPSNRIIVLEIQATSPTAAPAYATIVFHVALDDDTPPVAADLVFDATYYVGSYTSSSGLAFSPPITLAEGYDPDVVFTLEGESAQWFRIPTPSSNSVTLEISNPIPPAVVANNQKLVFVIRAQRPGGVAARATVVISLPDENTSDQVLGFDRLSYVGSIANNIVNLSPIVLREGPTSGVTFSLHGELASYFRVTPQGATAIVSLPSSIPVESIPSNRIIVLEIQATSPTAAPAYATIVFHVALDDDTPPVAADLVFDATYYVGSYTSSSGLAFSPPITLAEGYDPDVVFTLEGESAQWFRIPTPSSNSVTLEISNPIPPAVVANNQKLVFVIRAQRPGGVAARATVVISLPDENTSDQVLGFDRLSYVGSIANNIVNLSPIVLREGPTSGVTFSLHGELASYFRVTPQGATAIVSLPSSIPVESIPSNRIIVLEIQATSPTAAPAYATIVFHVALDDDTPPVAADLVFDATYYVGSYTSSSGLAFSPPITLAEGYDPDVVFTLEGESAQWFRIPTPSSNSVTLEISNPIPPAVVANNQKLVFVIRAQRPGGVAARATVVISLPDENTSDQVLGFDRLSYVGSIANNIVNLSPIVLREGPTSGVTFSLHGEMASYFRVTPQGATAIVSLPSSIPVESIPSNRIIVLEIQATSPTAAPAYATIVFHVVLDDDTPPVAADLVFDATYYVGSYTSSSGLAFSPPITLAEGYDPDVVFTLEGESAQWFRIPTPSSNSVTLEISNPIPPAVVANNQKLVFVIRAQRPGGVAARATVVISLPDENTSDQVLGFDRLSYVGSIANNIVNLSPIVLREGPTSGVTFSLHGELASYFRVTPQGATAIVSLPSSIPVESIPSNRIIVLEIQATSPTAAPAYATIVFHVALDDDTPPVAADLVFDATYYVGSYTSSSGLAFSPPITLAEGYDPDVVFTLEGESAQWFRIPTPSSNSVTLEISNPIPPAVVANNQKLVFVIRAQRPGGVAARATIVISLPDDGQDSSVAFDKVLYEGIIRGSAVHHHDITVTGYDETDITIVGVYASLFRANLSDGSVVVESFGTLTLPSDTRHVILELRLAEAGAVLILQVTATEEQPLPVTVSFERAPYVFSVENRYTGPVGQVRATADSGEGVTYSMQVENDHLRTRISISSDGELRLSAPAERGVYNLQAIATTEFTQATGQTTIQLSVQEVIDGPTVCGDDIVTAPLIIIDRNEEENHKNLVVLNATELPGCHYTLTNRWPVNQNWLYVDESGLHTTAIDREDQRIAHMALSQVQVELNLVCDGDPIRTKRSLDNRLDWLGPYDYGTKNWVVTDSIPFNSRRSIVNLIVNDINDNTPIFAGVENEPIIVGYPISDLEELVIPRSLSELQATDADVGVNAELLYWSEDPEIAVSPTTGFVHVRTDARLQDNMVLRVSATDRNGEGLTGSISLMVRLLDSENIAVITVRDAFLEDESSILGNLSNAIGYEVRPLRSVVVSTAAEEPATRKKRDATATSGTSLEVYVYGLIQREPVAVERLSNDINSAAIATVDIASILSLEDHLEGNEICVIPGRDTGLLVATIVLSVLLFILIVAAVVWFLLTRKRQENYDQFSDANSIASQNESASQPPKSDFVAKPRLNIEELKRSERRLQGMLNAPIDDVSVEPTPSSSNKDIINSETKIPLPDPLAPIVIQDKLKDAAEDSDEDEFGERKAPRRKSVVTFNENVEKIIHVDEEPDVISDPNYEVYKF